MTAPTMFPGFDGLMTLSRREGVDIRPTLLRVLTDLYVQSNVHTADEERQFVELTSRLIDEVDDATRAAVRARLSIYPYTPTAIAQRLSLRVPSQDQPMPLAAPIAPVQASAPSSPAVTKPLTDAQSRASNLSMQPDDASQINEMFFAANASERALILHNLADTPLRPAARIYPPRAQRAIEILQMAAFAADADNFTRELSDALILPARVALRVVGDAGGEPLACALKALCMPGAIFEQVLMFLDPALGSSVNRVYRLSRLYDNLSERTALIMLAAWRGATVAVTRAKYRPALYDDERQRARAASAPTRPAVQPAANVARTTGNKIGG
jgi:hypothetical protein